VRVKRLVCEFDLSPPTITEFKNEWKNTSTPLYVLVAYTWTTWVHNDHRNADDNDDNDDNS
jgi:hypothetical protein